METCVVADDWNVVECKAIRESRNARCDGDDHDAKHSEPREALAG